MKNIGFAMLSVRQSKSFEKACVIYIYIYMMPARGPQTVAFMEPKGNNRGYIYIYIGVTS